MTVFLVINMVSVLEVEEEEVEDRIGAKEGLSTPRGADAAGTATFPASPRASSDRWWLRGGTDEPVISQEVVVVVKVVVMVEVVVLVVTVVTEE